MYYDTSLKTSRVDWSVLFSPRYDPALGTFFPPKKGFLRKRGDVRERRNPSGHGRHYDGCTTSGLGGEEDPVEGVGVMKDEELNLEGDH